MAEWTEAKVGKAVEEILQVLGEPITPAQQEALTAFEQNSYGRVKQLSVAHLSDNFLKSLGYLGSAYKLTPNTDTILAESARAAAAYAQEKILSQLGSKIEGIFHS